MEVAHGVPLVFELLIGFALFIEGAGAVIDHVIETRRKAALSEAAALSATASVVPANLNVEIPAAEIREARV